MEDSEKNVTTSNVTNVSRQTSANNFNNNNIYLVK